MYKLSYIKAVSCGHPHVPYFSVLNEHQSWLNKFLCCTMQFEGRHLIVLTINGCMTHVGNERMSFLLLIRLMQTFDRSFFTGLYMITVGSV